MKKLLTEWRKFLKESEDHEDKRTFPAKVYYATTADQLPTIRDSGIMHLPTNQEIADDHVGVPTCSSPHDAKSFGSVIVEIDGAYLESCQQYESRFNSKGCRVSMRDSAIGSGSGSDVMVDRLGTRIPFDAVSGIIFTGTPNLENLKKSGFSNVEISSIRPDGEIENLHKPQEEI